MKKTLVAIAAASTLALTACSAQTTEARDYSSPTEWDAHLEEVSVTCNQNEWREYPLINADHVADCRDENGADVMRSIHPSSESIESRLGNLRDTTGWHESVPAVLTGPNWIVQCVTAEQCETWQDNIGGNLRTAPNY